MEAVAVPVRVGVVLDLSSAVGRKRHSCISTALHDFNLKHPRYATRVELRVMDSRGNCATTEHAAEDLIKNARVQAIIWGPHTLTEADQVFQLGRHHNHIPIITFSSASPTSCTFWLEDPVTASGGRPKFGFTLGSDSITFLDLKTDKRNGINLDRRKTSENCEGPHMNIAVPMKYGFKEFVDATDPNNLTGYSIDIFEASMGTLQPSPCYGYSVFHGTYDELVGNVSSGAFHLGSPLVHNLSIAILKLTGENGASKIEEKWFGGSSTPIGDGTVPDTDSGPLTLQSFSGLFVVTGSISTLMLLISIARRVYAKCTSLRNADVESASYNGDDDDANLLQNGMSDNPSPDQQPLGEADIDDSRGVCVNRQNAREGAPGPLQQNGMQGGSVPAEHIQIEMRTI
uniref:Uncharacterized protein n=1 Tax=Avena sativa TaxID=4498 RepID=A0ACD6A6X3_AVESA